MRAPRAQQRMSWPYRTMGSSARMRCCAARCHGLQNGSASVIPPTTLVWPKKWIGGGGIKLGLVGLRELKDTGATGTESKNYGHCEDVHGTLGNSQMSEEV